MNSKFVTAPGPTGTFLIPPAAPGPGIRGMVDVGSLANRGGRYENKEFAEWWETDHEQI